MEEPVATSLPEAMSSGSNPVNAEAAPYQVAAASGSEATFSPSQENVEVEMASGERMPLPALKALLRRQLEYYFSRENLSTDEYLQSQMDTDGFVAISTVAKFNQVRRLTDDHSLVVEVLRESAVVQVDETGEKVRPNPRSGVLILREIPESTPIKELEELFSSENCPKFLRCEFAHNNSWYVLFESDDDTQKAYKYLREEAKTFNGKPVMARIKAKAITSAPFTASYKNGAVASGAQEAAESYSVAANAAQPQQPQPPLQYTYNVTGDTYANQQVCPPFYPPTMLQAWAPTTPACVDLGTVLSVNGLSPQAAFRPLNNNTSRHSYTTRDSEPSSRYYGNGNRGYLQQPRHQQLAHHQAAAAASFPNLVGAGSCTFDYYSGSRAARSQIHGFGVDMNFFTAPNLYYSKLPSIYPTAQAPRPTHAHPVLLSREQAYSASASQGGGSQQSASSYSAKEATSKDGQAKENWTPSQRRPHNKRWWKENGASSNSNRNYSESSNGTYNKPAAESEAKPDSQKFDLETSAFPPLPGCLETDIVDVDVYESRLSDIVKGTVKPTTRDSKTQTTADSTVVPPPQTNPPDTFTPPASPEGSVKESTTTIEAETGDTCPELNDWEDYADDRQPSITHSVPDSPVFHPTLPNGSEHVPTDVGKSDAQTSAALPSPKSKSKSAKKQQISGKGDGSAKEITKAVVPEVMKEKGLSKPTKAPESGVKGGKTLDGDLALLSVNGHGDSESAVSSEDEKPFRKLTYSEVAMRAKEKVEKIALELKEKERQQHRPPASPQDAAQGRLPPPPPSSRPAFKELSRGRTPIEAARPALVKEWRERKKPPRAVSLPAAGQ